MAQSSASNVTPIHSGGILPSGAVAPNFTLHVTPDQTLTLSNLLGRPVILAFYPADWSPVCGDQMALYNEILPEFRKFGAELLGVSRLYGAYRAADGVCDRALFVLDKNGMIAWSYCSPVAVNPGADGILQALEDLPK